MAMYIYKQLYIHLMRFDLKRLSELVALDVTARIPFPQVWQNNGLRGVINKFVDNVCHFFNNPPMVLMFANKIVWLMCYKL